MILNTHSTPIRGYSLLFNITQQSRTLIYISSWIEFQWILGSIILLKLLFKIYLCILWVTFRALEDGKLEKRFSTKLRWNTFEILVLTPIINFQFCPCLCFPQLQLWQKIFNYLSLTYRPTVARRIPDWLTFFEWFPLFTD